jgi:hypothetical protein
MQADRAQGLTERSETPPRPARGGAPRAQRVAELARQVRAGQYRVTNRQIADAIIAHLLLLHDLAAGFAAAGSRLDDALLRN